MRYKMSIIPVSYTHLDVYKRQVGTLRSVGHKHGEWRDTVLMQRALGEGDNTPPQRP